MIQTSNRSWGLLTLCGVLDALFSAMLFLMPNANDSPILRTYFHGRSNVEQMGTLAVAAGVGTIFAALWESRRGRSWLLALNGVACGALGLMVTLGASRRVTLRSIALMIVVMAVSVCLYDLAGARAYRGHRTDEWLLGGAGTISLGFAGVFLAFVMRWFPLDPSPSGQTFYWLGSFFAFSAMCMVGMAFWRRAGFHRMASGAVPTS